MASRALDGYVAWQHPFRDSQIYVHPDVVRSLSAQAVDAAHHGSEVGGVLWGKAGPDDSLIIADAKLVPSSGPSFNTTATDIRNLQQALTGRAPAATLSLAGYFRSSMRNDALLTPQDQTVLRKYVTDPDSVFLILKPGGNGTCAVELSFWHDGALATGKNSGEIPLTGSDEQAHPGPAPLDSNGTPKRDASTRVVPEPATVRPRPASASQEEPSIVAMLRESAMRHQPSQRIGAQAPETPTKPEPSSSNRKWIVLLFAFIAACFITVVFVAGYSFGLPGLRAFLRGPEQRLKVGLDLRVARAADGQLSLNWNRDAPEIVSASGAVVTITDGRRLTKLKLDNAQLRLGKLLFVPKSRDVQVRVEVNTGNLHTVSESLRVPPPGTGTKYAKSARKGEGYSQPARASSSKSEWIVTAQDFPVPAPLTGAGTSNGISVPGGPKPMVVTENAPGVPNPALAAGSYIPPQAVEEMMPESTPLGQFARISVQVSIDQGGYVTSARVLKDGDSDNVPLATMATAAAQKWRFRPATLNGKPVPADYRIDFALRQRISQ